MKDEPIIMEHTVNAPVETIWKALTDKEQMKQWYFDIPAFRAQNGAEFSFLVHDNDGVEWVHLIRVKEVIPNKKLAYTWRYEGYAGDSLVTWELFEDGDRTRVRLTHTGLETFPAVKGLAREGFAEGWAYIVGTPVATSKKNSPSNIIVVKK